MIKDKRPYNILVIEDNPGDFILVDDFLREQISKPYIVHAVNYKQTQAILSGTEITFDVILLDLSLPDKSGQNLITDMLAAAPRYPIIVLTGYTDIDFGIKSISQGIFDYLLKDELTAASLYKSILYSIERKKIISELEKSEKRASDLFNLSPQPMWIYDPETNNFINVNLAAIEHYGYSCEEFLKMTVADICLKDEILITKEIIKNYKSELNVVFKDKFNHRKKSGEIIEVDLFSSPIVINDRNLISVIAIDVTEKNRYEHEIIKAIIKTQEDERYEIGGELHDNVCQVLVVSQISLSMLKDSISPGKMFLFDQCKGHISLVLDEIRNLSHRLAPAFFNDSTLEEAFSRLLNSFNIGDRFKILIHFDDTFKAYPVTMDLQVNFYRILQEQLRNIQKYAHATLIEVGMRICDNKLIMKISDDGVGFNVAAIKSGIGLANMKRRAELFSGRFEIESSPGNGCSVRVQIPIQKPNKLN